MSKRPLLYFLPEVLVVTARNCHDHYSNFGLSNVLTGANLECRTVECGPTTKHGCVLAECQGGARIGFYPKLQEWSEVAGGAYWIGYYRDAKPGPDDLGRAEQYGGHAVRLADGNEWLVPIVRLAGGDTGLPKAVKWGKDGALIQTVLPQYAELCIHGEELAEQVLENGVIDGDIDYLASLCVSALALNYRISKWETSALSLFTTPIIQSVLEAMIDVPTALYWMSQLKKNEGQ